MKSAKVFYYATFALFIAFFLFVVRYLFCFFLSLLLM